jgi:hypothetical protein
MAEGARYRFEPLQTRGLVLGLGPGQVAVLTAAVLVAFGVISSGHGAPGTLAGVAVLGLGAVLCRPVAGRPSLSWLGIGTAFLRRRRLVAEAPPAISPGHAFRLPARVVLPGLLLYELYPSGGQGPLGVLLDRRGGTAAALVRAKGGAFCLLDEGGKQRQLVSWGTVLESLATHRGSLSRLQWCQRSLPGDTSPLVAKLKAAGDPASPGYQAYLTLVEGARSWRHETLLVVAVRWQGGLSRRGQECADLLQGEVAALRTLLRSSGTACEPALDAHAVAAAVGAYLEPGLQRHPDAYPWPLSIEERWDALRVDGLWHRTYWVAEWPRSHVGPDFLSPLLIGAGGRSFSVVLSPVPPERAAREAESSRTAQLADSQLRSQGGFLETARHRRQAEALESREVQLADGRGAFELSGYVTVSAPDETGLQQSGAELERAAGGARLCLRLLYGQQREALGWTMPFGRGL